LYTNPAKTNIGAVVASLWTVAIVSGATFIGLGWI